MRSPSEIRPAKYFALTCLALASQVLLYAGPGQAGDKKTEADPQVAVQKKAAIANWKRAYEKDVTPSQEETEHLLLYGKVAGKTLNEVGQELEKQFELARKTLGMEKNDLWPGKLTVFLLPDRADFAPFIRRVEKRRPEPDETSSILIRSDEPHVVAAPPKGNSETPADRQAGEEIASALLTKKAGQGVPSWVVTGFGRATVTQSLSPTDRYKEHQRALQLVTQKKRSAADAWNGGVEESDSLTLRGSLIEYLAYSGRTSKFGPLLAAFRPNENGDIPPTDAAFKAAEIDGNRLHQLWTTWLRTGK